MALSRAEAKEMNDWEIESDLRTLIKAKEIRADKKRMQKIRALAKKKAEEMRDV